MLRFIPETVKDISAVVANVGEWFVEAVSDWLAGKAGWLYRMLGEPVDLDEAEERAEVAAAVRVAEAVRAAAAKQTEAPRA